MYRPSSLYMSLAIICKCTPIMTYICNFKCKCGCAIKKRKDELRDDNGVHFAHDSLPFSPLNMGIRLILQTDLETPYKWLTACVMILSVLFYLQNEREQTMRISAFLDLVSLNINFIKEKNSIGL